LSPEARRGSRDILCPEGDTEVKDVQKESINTRENARDSLPQSCCGIIPSASNNSAPFDGVINTSFAGLDYSWLGR